MPSKLYIPFLISFIIILIGFMLVYIILADVDYRLILHFDIYRGIDLFGTENDVYGILSLALVIVSVNFFLAVLFYYQERFLSYLLAAFSNFLAVLILIAIGVIISVN